MKENLQKTFSSLFIHDIKVSLFISDIFLKANVIGIILDNTKVKQLDKESTENLEETIKTNLQVKYPNFEILIVRHNEQESVFEKKAEDYFKKQKVKIENVKKIISIVSCKGGVGKSTTVVNLANILSRKGFKVAILDSDIYGPSIPTMLGLNVKPEVKGGKFIPIMNHGIKSISMGYLIDKGLAAMWRGPIITKTLKSLFLNVEWGELDYLLIDTPPGTGDVHLSIAENFIIDGAIVISTPQNVAIEEAERMINMLKKFDINICGVVENMSYLEINGQRVFLFGEGGGKKIAQKYSLEFLGEIQINESISKMLDQGKFYDLDNKTLQDYYDIWKKIAKSL
jgi:ATP-binding protein involved in chromosome partitioning